jgi:hypothetical protein
MNGKARERTGKNGKKRNPQTPQALNQKIKPKHKEQNPNEKSLRNRRIDLPQLPGHIIHVLV